MPVVRRLLVPFPLLLALTTGCGQPAEEKPPAGTGPVKELTDTVAEEAAERIRTPMDQARGVAELGDRRLEAMEEAQGQEKRPGDQP
ncbi:MAG: hypothetical protein AB1634_12850 [Thermodesulfobacteriota bacterium]